MKIRQSILLAICIAGFAATSVKAQQATPAAGGEAYGPGGWVSYTIGQAAYLTINDIGGTMTEGVQQAIEIFILSGIEETDIQLNCAVYPNPASEYVVLGIETPVTDQLNYVLFDTQGKILSYNKIENNETRIALSSLSNSIYYIKVLKNNTEVKTFKIVKNK